MSPFRQRLHLWLIQVFSVFVPRAQRLDWRREWEAELSQHEFDLRARQVPESTVRRELLTHGAGAVRDALSMRWRRAAERCGDTRHALRMIRRSPGLAAAAILSSRSASATTAVFAPINAALLRPLCISASIASSPSRGSIAAASPSPAFTMLARGTVRPFSAADTLSFVLGGDGVEQIAPTRDAGVRRAVGLDGELRPRIGRAFAPADYAGERASGLISHRLWTRRYGGSPDIVGQTISIDASPARVVGVLSERFDFFADSDLLGPLPIDRTRAANPFYRHLQVLGRMKPGMNATLAAAQLTLALNRVTASERVRLELVRDQLVQDLRRSLLTLWVLTSFVLVIGCLNFANLLTARGSARAREIAVRAALGAGRARIARQLVTEAVVLGLPAASRLYDRGVHAWISRRGVLSTSWARTDPADLRVAFAGASHSSPVSFGLEPALKATALTWEALLGGIRGRERSGLFGTRRPLGSILVAAQVALTLVVLTGAALLLKSFWRLEQYRPGYDTAYASTLQFELPQSRYATDADIARFVDDVTSAVRDVPGVRAVGASSSMPLLISGFRYRAFTIEGEPTRDVGAPESTPLGIPPPPPPPPPGLPTIELVKFYQAISGEVGPGFFDAMKIPVLAGREFAAADTAGSLPVAIVNQAFADRYWHGVDPIGRRIRLRPIDPWITVVGVVGNIRRFARDDAMRSEFYRPFAQLSDRRIGDTLGKAFAPAMITEVNFVVRTTASPDDLAAAVRGILAARDPALPISRLATLQGTLDEAVAPRRFLTRLFFVFGASALLLAGVGVDGVTTYLTRRRSREMAIRVALGATPVSIEALVMLGVIAAFGLITGVAITLGLARYLQGYLYEVSPFDVTVYAGVAATLGSVVLVASFLPARRAGRVDPVTILKSD